jgi:hypothetical protein
VTTAIHFDTVANSIAALTITGITVLSVDDVPESAQTLTPIMFPRPNDFITNLHEVQPERTFGTSGAEASTWEYTLNYMYLHCQIGATLGGLNAIYAGAITNIIAISDVIMNNDTLTGAADVRLETIPSIGQVLDPGGKFYYGCELAVTVREYTGG